VAAAAALVGGAFGQVQRSRQVSAVDTRGHGRGYGRRRDAEVRVMQ
jgi:hypothetical protein